MTFLKGEWYDWTQPCGRVVRICYTQRFREWPFESIERVYSQKAIDFIGGTFNHVPMTA